MESVIVDVVHEISEYIPESTLQKIEDQTTNLEKAQKLRKFMGNNYKCPGLLDKFRQIMMSKGELGRHILNPSLYGQK